MQLFAALSHFISSWVTSICRQRVSWGPLLLLLLWAAFQFQHFCARLLLVVVFYLLLFFFFFTIRQPLGRGCAYGSIKNPHVQCPKKLDVVVVAVGCRWVPSPCCCSSCDIIQARCNDVDNETMDSSTHTPTAPAHTEQGPRQKALHDDNCVVWWVSVLSSSLPSIYPRTRPQIARHIIIVVFNLCAPKEIANSACPLFATLQT